jgi:hypothetical protein
MIPTQKDLSEKMISNREHFLCRLLDVGGKCLENEDLAFQKKYFCCIKQE